jgi:hypothetical protein
MYKKAPEERRKRLNTTVDPDIYPALENYFSGHPGQSWAQIMDVALLLFLMEGEDAETT